VLVDRLKLTVAPASKIFALAAANLAATAVSKLSSAVGGVTVPPPPPVAGGVTGVVTSGFFAPSICSMLPFDLSKSPTMSFAVGGVKDTSLAAIRSQALKVVRDAPELQDLPLSITIDVILEDGQTLTYTVNFNWDRG